MHLDESSLTCELTSEHEPRVSKWAHSVIVLQAVALEYCYYMSCTYEQEMSNWRLSVIWSLIAY